MFEKSNIACGAVVPVVLMAVLAGTGKSTDSASNPAGRIMLEQYLVKAGVKLDCYFTIEKEGGAKLSSLSTAYIAEDEEDCKDIDSLVSKLRRNLADSTITQDANNPAVVHIIENSLKQVTDYTLDKRVSIGDL